MHEPNHTPPTDPPPPPVAPDRPTAKERPARELKDGAFDDSVAGEEDPGAGIDTMVPRPALPRRAPGACATEPGTRAGS